MLDYQFSGLPKQLHFFNDNNVSNFAETDKVFDELFDFGIFGISTNTQASSVSKKSEFKFAFVGDNINYSVHTFIADKDLIAISPMFKEYCGCLPSEAVVIPISLED